MSIIYHVEPDDSGLAQHCLDQRQELRRVGGVRRRILILSLFYCVAGSVLRLLKVLRWLNCKKMKFQRPLFHSKAAVIQRVSETRQQAFDYSLCFVQIVESKRVLHCTPTQNLPSGFCWPRGPTNPHQKDV